jgi:signal transduction histidine kinase
MVEISELMNASTEEEELLTCIIRAAKIHLEVQRVSVMLIENNHLKIVAAEGLSLNYEDIVIPLGKGISGKVAQTGEEIVINNAGDSKEDVGYQAKSYMCVPLKVKDNIIGVLNLTDKIDDYFDEDDIKIAKYIASQCALAVERFELYKEKSKSKNLKILGEFTSSITHDIKNLLNVVQGYVELMEIESSDNPEFKVYVDAVYTELKLIHGLTLDIMDFAKNKISLKLETFYISELLDNINYHTNILLNQSKKQFIIEKDEDFQMTADKDKLFRVFFNLINNSIEAVDEETGIIKLTVKIKDKNIYFKLYDNGHGIKKENIDKIFDPFFTEGKTKGTGLGLAVVNEIIKSHKGEIKVKSEEGKFTEFNIKIPVLNDTN